MTSQYAYFKACTSQHAHLKAYILQNAHLKARHKTLFCRYVRHKICVGLIYMVGVGTWHLDEWEKTNTQK